MRAGTEMGRGTNGRRPSGMLYVRDAEQMWQRDYPPIEVFAREIGARVTEHGSIQIVDLNARKTESSARPADDWLPVLCWCEEATVRVASAAVRAGLTRSCFRRGCGPELLRQTAAERKALAAWRRKIDRWNAEQAGVPHDDAVVWEGSGTAGSAATMPSSPHRPGRFTNTGGTFT